MWELVSITDFLLGPIVLLMIIIFSKIYVGTKIHNHPEYKYFFPGLMAKLIGSLGLWYVYTFYYPGGDTFQYYVSALDTINLFPKNPYGFFSMWLGPHDIRKYAFFDEYTTPPFYYKDPNTYFVVKMIIPLAILSFKSYIVCSLLLATISFFGIWSLYKIYIQEYPEIKKGLAIAIFFVPSVFFWGSGLLKDTITLSMVGFYVACFYRLFIRKNRVVGNLIGLCISSFIILSIKPYILFGLVPGSLFWIINRVLSGIRGEVLRFFSAPVLILLVGMFGYGLLYSLSGTLGAYSVDTVLKRASEVQRDLKQDYYKGNSFDIGDYEANISSMLLYAPAAINAALFRPYIWEANNLVMFLSSIENFIMLIFTIRVLLMTRIFFWVKYLMTHHLLTFSIIFSLFFAVSVGISASNFGSLVRYKIPAIPFFISSLFIIKHLWQKEKQAKENPVIPVVENLPGEEIKAIA